MGIVGLPIKAIRMRLLLMLGRKMLGLRKFIGIVLMMLVLVLLLSINFEIKYRNLQLNQ